MRQWERAGSPSWVAHGAAWLIPGLALAGPGRLLAVLTWVCVSASVVALLLCLGLTAQVWPVAVLLLLPAWLLAATLAVRARGKKGGATPSPQMVALLGLLHWAPALVVLVVTLPGWVLLNADNPASLPALVPGEIAACRISFVDEPIKRGTLVLADGPEGRFLGRALGLPGERVEPDGDGWRIDGVPAARSERDLLLPPREEKSSGTRSLVYRVDDSYLALWSRGMAETTVGKGTLVDLAADQWYVLALDHGGGASLDSRAWGAFSKGQVHSARCLLLWSTVRAGRIGRPVP